jgi:DNA-binding response OmpR family regulator
VDITSPKSIPEVVLVMVLTYIIAGSVFFLTAAELTRLHEIDSDVINDLGTDCFVTKPMNTTDLINRLKVILSQE